jgi:hypothetical protein
LYILPHWSACWQFCEAAGSIKKSFGSSKIKSTAESDPGGIFVFTYLSISVKSIIDIAEEEKRG